MSEKSIYEEIIIEWSDFQDWNSFLKQPPQARVLYQIYCDSHIYGSNVLAYIGQTSRIATDRIKEHDNSYFQFANNKRVSVGKLAGFEGDLSIPESILIANHKPFFNQINLHTVSKVAFTHKIIIINNGNHGMLKNSCTNYWWYMDKNSAPATL